MGFGTQPVPGSDGVEATGLAAAALARTDANDPLVPRLMDALRTQRLHRLSDRAEAAALEALANYFGAAKPAAASYELTIQLNGEAIRTLKSADALAPMAVVIAAEKLKAKNTLKLSIKGRGEVAVDAFLSGILPGFDPKARSRYASVNRQVEPASLVFRGSAIPRGFSIVDGPVTTFVNDVKNLTVGSEAEVLVLVQFPRKEAQLLDYAVLEEPIPAGCEVVPASIQGSVRAGHDPRRRDHRRLRRARPRRLAPLPIVGIAPGRLPGGAGGDPLDLPPRSGRGKQRKAIGGVARGHTLARRAAPHPDELYRWGSRATTRASGKTAPSSSARRSLSGVCAMSRCAKRRGAF